MRPANPHGLTLPTIPDQAAQRTGPANVDVFNQGAPATPDAAPADPSTPGNEQSDASRAVEVPRLSASLRGPMGMNRVFLDTAGSRDPDAALAALRKGEGFASNGPLLGLLVDGRKPGAELPAGKHAFRIALRSPVEVQHLELVHNGRVVRTFELTGDRRTFDAEGELELGDGWLLLRAWNEQADPGVLDLYPYATTNPVWIGRGRASENVRADAAYFTAWLDRVIANATAREPDFNDAGEFDATLDYLRAARARYAALAAGSTE